MKIALLLFPLCLLGCQSQTVPTPVASTPPALHAVQPNARIPARIGHYTMGSYVDPDNELIRHEAHAIQRVESAAHWDLRPAPLPVEVRPKPTDAAVSVTASDDPEEKPTSSPAEPAEPAPPKPAVTPTLPPDTQEPALSPDTEGRIDLTALANTSDPDINPFAIRRIDPSAKREIKLQIGGIIHGPVSCVLVNGLTLQAGDTIESLSLVRIEAHSLLFRYHEQLLRLPVASNPITLVMPRA